MIAFGGGRQPEKRLPPGMGLEDYPLSEDQGLLEQVQSEYRNRKGLDEPDEEAVSGTESQKPKITHIGRYSIARYPDGSTRMVNPFDENLGKEAAYMAGAAAHGVGNGALGGNLDNARAGIQHIAGLGNYTDLMENYQKEGDERRKNYPILTPISEEIGSGIRDGLVTMFSGPGTAAGVSGVLSTTNSLLNGTKEDALVNAGDAAIRGMLGKYSSLGLNLKDVYDLLKVAKDISQRNPKGTENSMELIMDKLVEEFMRKRG
jgi:hypothetical protein